MRFRLLPEIGDNQGVLPLVPFWIARGVSLSREARRLWLICAIVGVAAIMGGYAAINLRSFL